MIFTRKNIIYRIGICLLKEKAFLIFKPDVYQAWLELNNKKEYRLYRIKEARRRLYNWTSVSFETRRSHACFMLRVPDDIEGWSILDKIILCNESELETVTKLIKLI